MLLKPWPSSLKKFQNEFGFFELTCWIVFLDFPIVVAFCRRFLWRKLVNSIIMTANGAPWFVAAVQAPRKKDIKPFRGREKKKAFRSGPTGSDRNSISTISIPVQKKTNTETEKKKGKKIKRLKTATRSLDKKTKARQRASLSWIDCQLWLCGEFGSGVGCWWYLALGIWDLVFVLGLGWFSDRFFIGVAASSWPKLVLVLSAWVLHMCMCSFSIELSRWLFRWMDGWIIAFNDSGLWMKSAAGHWNDDDDDETETLGRWQSENSTSRKCKFEISHLHRQSLQLRGH